MELWKEKEEVRNCVLDDDPVRPGGRKKRKVKLWMGWGHMGSYSLAVTDSPCLLWNRSHHLLVSGNKSHHGSQWVRESKGEGIFFSFGHAMPLHFSLHFALHFGLFFFLGGLNLCIPLHFCIALKKRRSGLCVVVACCGNEMWRRDSCGDMGMCRGYQSGRRVHGKRRKKSKANQGFSVMLMAIHALLLQSWAATDILQFTNY